MIMTVRDLTKSYGEKIALKQFSYMFEHGVYGILGPNGAGKSTLMKLLTDSIKRESGEILVDDIDILKQKKNYCSKLGYMAQNQELFPDMSAWEFLSYVAALKGISKKESTRQIDELMSSLHLEDSCYRKLGGFSGGMKRRVLLAQALLGEPEILILDEPTAGLDPKERIRIRNLISELAQNRTVLLSTHVVSDIECIAQQVLLLKEGELIKVDHSSNLIASLNGKVYEKYCTIEEMTRYQKEYGLGNIYQRSKGQLLRLVGDQRPEGFEMVNHGIGLEDVYLYYFERAVK